MMEDYIKKRIDEGKMKIVEARMLMVVPANVSLVSVATNVKNGVSFIIDEHLFRNLDVTDGDDIVDGVDGVYLLNVSCEDVRKV